MRYLTIIFLFITTFAIGQQQMFLRSTPAAGVTGILDSYTGSEAAYATALLYSSYGGSCLRVRRDSDNAEQDIGFSGQDIDEASITSFCSGANCYVTTWYDQSGNGLDITNSTLSEQPKIYDSSTAIIYENSIPAIDFQSDRLTRTAFNVSTPNLFSVQNFKSGNSGYGGWIKNAGPAINGFLISSTLNAPTQPILSQFNGSTSVMTYARKRNSARTLPTGQFLESWTFSGSTIVELYENSSSITTAPPGGGWPYSEGFFMGAITYTGAVIAYTITMQCVVIFDGDQSANRTGIETAINNYYNIYP
jgi:hypothetical protein